MTFPTYDDILHLAAAQISYLLNVSRLPQALVAREQTNPSRLLEPDGRGAEVLADVGAERTLVIARVLAHFVDAIIAEW